MSDPSPSSDVSCPFCDATDFDLVGLKHHLLHHCEPFAYTPGVDEERREILAELDARTREAERSGPC